MIPLSCLIHDFHLAKQYFRSHSPKLVTASPPLLAFNRVSLLHIEFRSSTYSCRPICVYTAVTNSIRRLVNASRVARSFSSGDLSGRRSFTCRAWLMWYLASPNTSCLLPFKSSIKFVISVAACSLPGCIR